MKKSIVIPAVFAAMAASTATIAFDDEKISGPIIDTEAAFPTAMNSILVGDETVIHKDEESGNTHVILSPDQQDSLESVNEGDQVTINGKQYKVKSVKTALELEPAAGEISL